jgi:hypothetical protein
MIHIVIYKFSLALSITSVTTWLLDWDEIMLHRESSSGKDEVEGFDRVAAGHRSAQVSNTPIV